MGFYLRKSVRVGPLRFNLSKSGIGVSAGIPGFRVGSGPRGNYVHAGRNGFYYRATQPRGKRTIAPRPTTHERSTSSHTLGRPDPTLGPEIEIESGSVLMMNDDSAAGLLSELNEKRSRWRFTPIAAAAVMVIGLCLWPSLTTVGDVALGVVGAIALVAVYQVDLLRKSTVIMYDLDGDAGASFQGLIDAVQHIRRAQRVWHVASSATVLDRKYHAGANAEIRRAATNVAISAPSFVKCNVDVPSIGVGRQTLFFFPDRLLIFDSGSVGAVSYSALSIERQTTRFIEAEGVPSDSRVVGRTWRYVNKNGGPDRRFKDNRELPICEYEALHFRSASGLNELLNVSRVGAGESLLRYLSLEGPRFAR